MRVAKQYISYKADQLLHISKPAEEAFQEINIAIRNMVGQINNSRKKINSVSPIKRGLVDLLHFDYGWETEHHINALRQGGGIDIYKQFLYGGYPFNVGIEFETGNVASVHRSLNKMLLGYKAHELDLIVLVLPISYLAQFLTDRCANYEEIEPYFSLYDEAAFIALGFEADDYSPEYPIYEKGNDGNHYYL